MNSVTKCLLLLYSIIAVIFLIQPLQASQDQLLRDAAIRNGLTPAEDTHHPIDLKVSIIGKKLFDSTSLSLNGDISCRTCHLEDFSSADGIPNAVGVGGSGEGPKRGISGGSIVPRNTLPMWGRGGLGFDVFFWDGKVDFSKNQNISQFGSNNPSKDALVTAVHLPPLEIREMLIEDKIVSEYKHEDTNTATKLYDVIIQNLRENEPELIYELISAFNLSDDNLSFKHIAISIASSIRDEFKLKSTKFHDFVFKNGEMTPEEIRGGVIFYGKGKCAVCHSGAYFTDFKFYNLPFPQIGFGKNGFGIDYGRFNVTANPSDLYKFRTPPLYNAEKTSPYGHSGSIRNIDEVILYHFDPLAAYQLDSMRPFDRHELYKRISLSSSRNVIAGYLDKSEIADVIEFIKTLNF